MTNSNYLFVLGASDPEMAAIENLLRNCGQAFVYALQDDGQRVHPGSAYRHCRPSSKEISLAIYGEPDWDITDINLAYVECGNPAHLATGDIRIDHHRPGDPGYGQPPSEYWEASSLGQVYELLTLKDFYVEGRQLGIDNFPQNWGELKMVAAADHCLAAAYKDQCPEVDPQALRAWRIKSRAEFQGRSELEILADVERAEAALKSAPRIEIGGAEIADLRGPVIPELPEAATYLGLGYLAEVADRDGRRKIVISAGENTLREFMGSLASAQGLTDIYGDPVRGFAGGYVQ